MTPLQTVPLVLASASPRRKELLAFVGVPFVVDPSHVDEIVRPGERPKAFARRAAYDKGIEVAKRRPDEFVLSADTIVSIDEAILGKPRNRADARRMLALLSGRTHEVHTAVCLLRASDGHRAEEVVTTRVTFRDLSSAEVAAYARTGECDDKAGSYAAQGQGTLLVEWIDGSFTNVVGLPMTTVLSMLRAAGIVGVSRSGRSWYGPGREVARGRK